MNEQQLAAVKQALEAFRLYQRTLAPTATQIKGEEAITALQSIISQDALDKMAENARELGLDYEPAVIQQMVDALDHADELLGGNDTLVMNGAAAGRWLLEQPAVHEPVAWTDLLKQAEEVVRSKSLWKKYIDGTPLANDIAVWMASFAQEHTTPPAPQPVPVKTYHDGKPWPVAPKPWVGLTDEEAQWIYDNGRTPSGMMEMVEAKLKEKNHDQ
jgi:hypothetical protein